MTTLNDLPEKNKKLLKALSDLYDQTDKDGWIHNTSIEKWFKKYKVKNAGHIIRAMIRMEYFEKDVDPDNNTKRLYRWVLKNRPNYEHIKSILKNARDKINKDSKDRYKRTHGKSSIKSAYKEQQKDVVTPAVVQKPKVKTIGESGWDTYEDTFLDTRSDLPDKKIAELLGKSETAVACRKSKLKKIRQQKQDKLIKKTSKEFVEFIDDTVIPRKKYLVRELWELYKKVYPFYKRMTNITFKKWIEHYVRYNSIFTKGMLNSTENMFIGDSRKTESIEFTGKRKIEKKKLSKGRKLTKNELDGLETIKIRGFEYEEEVKPIVCEILGKCDIDITGEEDLVYLIELVFLHGDNQKYDVEIVPENKKKEEKRTSSKRGKKMVKWLKVEMKENYGVDIEYCDEAVHLLVEKLKEAGCESDSIDEIMFNKMGKEREYNNNLVSILMANLDSLEDDDEEDDVEITKKQRWDLKGFGISIKNLTYISQLRPKLIKFLADNEVQGLDDDEDIEELISMCQAFSDNEIEDENENNLIASKIPVDDIDFDEAPEEKELDEMCKNFRFIIKDYQRLKVENEELKAKLNNVNELINS